MSKEIINVSTEILKVHPRNTEFFDDISGDEYERFKHSIKNDGVLSPILVSPDMTIISGHQRLKACKDLGIKLIPIMIREDLTEEDDKLKILLAANFGRTKNDESKQRKIAVEYVNLCGLKQGRPEKRCDNRTLNLDEIASQLGTNKRSLQELLAIERKLTPEMKEIIDNGTITKTTASKVLTKLSPAEQEELLKSLPTTEKLTQKQVQEYIDKLKEKDNQIAGYEMKLNKIKELENQINNLEQELENRPTIEKVKEVTPVDYEDTKHKLRNSQEDYSFLKRDYDNKVKQLNELRAQLKTQKEQEPQEQFGEKLKNSVLLFCAKTAKFIEEVGGYAWLTDYFNQIPNTEKQGYIKSINALDGWINTMKNNM